MRISRCFLLILFSLFAISMGSASGNSKYITIAFDGDYAPYSFKNNKGEFKGIAVDFANEIAQRVGIQLKIYPEGTWKTLYKAALNKEVDVIATLVMRPERKEWFEFTQPYISLAQYIITRNEPEAVQNKLELTGKTLALVEKYSTTQHILENYPDITPYNAVSLSDALRLVSMGKADATIAPMGMAQYMISREGLLNMQFADLYGQGLSEQRFGVRKDLPEIAAILDKGLSSITDQERLKIFERWSRPEVAEMETVLASKTDDKNAAPLSSLHFTREEQIFIDQHPVIRVGNEMDWPPFDYAENGVAKGYCIDIIKLLGEKAGLNLEFVNGYAWVELMKMTRNGKIDLLPATAIAPERKEFLIFSNPYLDYPTVLITHEDDKKTTALKDFHGKKVAIVDGYYYLKVARKTYPKIAFLAVKGFPEGLKAVSNKEVDGFIGSRTVIRYTMRKHLIDNLRVVGRSGLDDPMRSKLRVSVRKDLPVLLSIVNKGLSAISEAERAEIARRWIDVEGSDTHFSKEGPRSQTSWITVIQGGLVLIFLIAVTLILFRLLDHSKKDPLAYQFSSPLGRRLAVMFNATLIVLVILLSWGALNNIKTKIKNDRLESLQSVLNTTHATLNIWVNDQKNKLNNIAADPKVVAFAMRQLDRHTKGEALLGNHELKGLREIFLGLQKISDHIGFFVIAPDGISVASMRDSNIAHPNVIEKERPDLLKRAFKGETLFIPPIPSQISIKGAATIMGLNRPATMFFASPIRNSKGEVVAVLTKRLDPYGDFSRINLLGRIGKSGETYAFNRKGKLLSQSRFTHQLKQAGLINKEKQSILSISIRNPGANLMKGEHRKIKKTDYPLTRMAKSAVSGESSYDDGGYIGYRGVRVFGVWFFNNTLGIGMTSEIDAAEAMEAYTLARVAVFIILIVTTVVSFAFTLLIMILGSRANLALKFAHDKLEERVSIRTRELSDAKDIAEAAKQSLEFVQYAVDHTVDMAFWIAIDDATLFYVNETGARRLGYSQEQLVGQPVSKFDPEFPLERWPQFAEKLRTKEPMMFESTHQTIDSRQYPVEITARYVEFGEIRRVIAFARDITERKIAEAALKLDEERLEALLKLSQIKYTSKKELTCFALEECVRLTSSKVGYLHYFDDTQKELDLFSWSKETQKTCTAEKTSHYPLESAGIWADCIRKREPVIHNDYQNYPRKKGLPEGHFKLIRHMSIPVFDDGEIVAVTGFGNKEAPYDESDIRQLTLFMDSMWRILKQRDAEQALKTAKEAAEAATKAKSIFLSNMSHEIRTPMNAILGYSQIMQHDQTLSDEQKNNLTIINRSGDHLLALINDVLEMSKIEAGRIELNPVPFDLHGLIKDLEMMFRVRTNEKNLSFSIETDPDLPHFLWADEGKIRQVLINLMGNAVKFTSQGGICLSASMADSASAKKTSLSRVITFKVTDTGSGVPKDQMESIFEAFEQTVKGRNTEGGTGLGLSISRQYARMMDGDITLRSEEDKGSSFCFEMVAEETDIFSSESKINAQRRIVRLKEGQMPHRILVVDDRDCNVDILSKILIRVGFEIRQATNGKEAVDLFQTFHPHAIMMDIRMPVMDGIEATKRIRTLENECKLDKKKPAVCQSIIIAVSASALENQRKEITQNGLANDFIGKPYKEHEIFDSLQKLLDIEYIYEENNDNEEIRTPKKNIENTVHPKSILPDSLIHQLRNAIISLDVEQIRKLIKEVHSHHAELSEKMTQLVDRFEFELLGQLLDE